MAHRDRTHKARASLRKRDDRPRGTRTLCVLDDSRLTALEHGHARVGRAKIDADCLCHLLASSCRKKSMSGYSKFVLARPVTVGGWRLAVGSACALAPLPTANRQLRAFSPPATDGAAGSAPA